MAVNTETKINALRNRINLLESRGPHNAKIVKKLERKIRSLSR